MPLNPGDLQQLSDICNSICYHLTAHLSAVAAGVPSSLPPQVAQIYQLASKLPKAEPAQWLALTSAGAAAAAAAAAAGPSSGRKHHKWTPEMEAELVRLVDDEAFRLEKLGAPGCAQHDCAICCVGSAARPSACLPACLQPCVRGARQLQLPPPHPPLAPPHAPQARRARAAAASTGRRWAATSPTLPAPR